ncbi:MAG: anthranilate synthase component I family protein, partial [Candidatus Binatia bacterium]
FLDLGDFQILSNSPELFLERRGLRVATRPIKGTRPRGATADADAGLIEELRRDAKERAEHLMIVDLERSDLGRIAEIGSIEVEDFAAVESYATLHHLESTVCGKVPPELPFSAFLRALFPGGSITGAPKIRAMQILEELETEGRGFYTGGILHYPPGRDFSMSICIRTATVRGGRVRYAAGGGLVADSNVEAEHAECLLKARAFFTAATGETP